MKYSNNNIKQNRLIYYVQISPNCVFPNINTMPFNRGMRNPFKSWSFVPFIGKNSVTWLWEGHALSFGFLTTSSKSLKVGFRYLYFPVIFSHSEIAHGQLLFGVSQSFLSRAVYSCYLHPENCKRILVKKICIRAATSVSQFHLTLRESKLPVFKLRSLHF